MRGAPRQRPFVGWAWHLSAAAATLVVIWRWPANLPVLGGPMVMAFFLVPALLYKQGHRHFVASATRARAGDTRGPVLYFRAFSVESSLRDHEEALAKIFRSVGPFVALGAPRDSLPPLGARRDYVIGEDWISVVTEWIKKAQCIVVMAGGGSSLAAEIQRCRKEVEPKRLLVAVQHDDEAAYVAFSASCAGVGLELPSWKALVEMGAQAHATTHSRALLLALVSFGDDWRAHAEPMHDIVVFDPVTTLDKHEAQWRDALRAPLTRLHIDPRENFSSLDLREHWRILVLAALVLCAAWALGLTR